MRTSSHRTSAVPVRSSLVLHPLGALSLALVLSSCGDSPGEPPQSGTPPELPQLQFVPAQLSVEPVATGLNFPLHLTAPPGDDRLFVVERFGLVRILQAGEVLVEPFLDVREKIATDGSERGLLSLAFHPDYESNGFLYVMYTAKNGAVTVERYTVSDADADAADPTTGKTIISVPHPNPTHNGGLVVFGPDGRMYLSIGDGGGRGDPQKNGRNLGVLLGKILRIDVDAGDPYAIPADNPFRTRAGARPEIWASGLRNPWRFAFAGDGVDRRLYIADVGMDLWEEINVAPAATGGLDFGWSTTEGAHCFGREECDFRGITFPVHEYGHAPPCTSVTGGYEYEGGAHPEHLGRYFFADYCLGWLRSIRVEDGAVTESLEWSAESLGRITSFGRGGDGELYLLLQDGSVVRIGAMTS